MKNSIFEDMIALIGGAGIGAAMMYLFDPDQGTQRRQDVAHTAKEAVAATGDAVGATLHEAGHTARSMAERISDYARNLATDAGERLTNIGSRAGRRARETARSAATSAQNYVADATQHADDLRHRLTDRAGANESHPYRMATGITAGSLAILGLGAGLMYFLDPQRGRTRRALLRDKTVSFARRTGHQARRYGRHLGHRLQGVAHQAGESLPHLGILSQEEWSQQQSTPVGHQF